MPNLAAKYRPKTFEDVTEQKIVVDIVKNMCQNKHLETRNFLFTGPAGCGKAQPLSSLVLTTTGYKQMKDIKVGEHIYTHNFNIGIVKGIYPQGVRSTYTLVFQDREGSYRCTVADNHLNCIWIKFPNGAVSYIDSIDTLNLKNLFCNNLEFDICVKNPRFLADNSSLEFLDMRNNEFDIHVPKDDFLYLTNIIPEDRQECQCIYIDHLDHTYITNDWIPTHNTTLARIIANELNERKGAPIEIDAASNSGVDSMRQIIEQARSYPVGMNWKVFIMDEVHSFSSAAWQAALKTIEEPPAKSIFLFATTNPEKIPATIISRVQTFQLSKISLQGIEDRLKYIIDCENKEGQGITYEDSAISYIAKMANGGMRDSITLLEKAIASSKNITSESLMESLGLPNYDDFFELLSAYSSKNNTRISEVIDKVYNSGVNFTKWMIDFHSFSVNIIKYIYLRDVNKTMIPAHYESKISKYGVSHSVVCLKLANKLVKLNQELRFSQYQQELALTYLCSIPKSTK